MEQKPILKTNVQKIRSKIKTFNRVAIICLLIQIAGYLTSRNNVYAAHKTIAYYIGYHLWIIASIILFVKAANLRSKLDEIKKNDTPNTKE